MWKPWGRKRSTRPPTTAPSPSNSQDTEAADVSPAHRQPPPAEVANLRARLTSEGFSYRH